jgi:hypothetical protein
MTDEDRIAELLLRWEEAWEHGQEIGPEELCDGRPDLVGVLRDRIAAIKDLAWVKEDAGMPAPDEEVPGEEAAQPFPKTLAGRYRIEALIAEGGYGQVFRGFDPELQRPVAIKIPRPRQGSRGEPFDSLLDEARKAASLRHPGIVAVHDAGREDGLLFIVSDLIEGTNLADAIAGNRPGPQEAARLIADVAEALHHAHEQGFVHRDIKPANILIDSQGKALLTDFGIAATKDELDQGKAATSGTLAYMAPEQVAGEIQLVDARTDIYALGMVLYELLAGRHPYQGRTPTVLREQILFRPAMSLRAADSSIPVELEAICMRCLAKHPADRYLTARALAAALRRFPASHRIKRITRIGIAVALVLAVVLTAFAGNRYLPLIFQTNQPGPDQPAHDNEGGFVFDGKSRIVTPLERFAPVTLEAWVRPDGYLKGGWQYVVGSDIPTKWGIGVGLCEAILAIEYIGGNSFGEQAVPLGQWSHIAAVFGESETRLYLNGKRVGTGPATKQEGGTTFVIGSVGKGNPIGFFKGRVRAVRISKGERYTDGFTPPEEFGKANDSVMIYEWAKVEEDRVIDLSGNGNHGTWERLPVP